MSCDYSTRKKKSIFGDENRFESFPDRLMKNGKNNRGGVKAEKVEM
jgi:hypothetical protein